MRSLRFLSGGALLGLLALWSGCGGVSDPGPLSGYDDGSGGSAGSAGATGSDTDEPVGSAAAGGRDRGMQNGGSSGSEGVDPELGIDSNGGRAGSSGVGGSGPVGAGGTPVGTGGTESGTGGTESGTGGTETGIGGTDSGAGGTESGTGGSFNPGTGGTETGTGGTETGIGGTDSGAGGTESGTGGSFDPGTGGTETGSGGSFDPGTGGTESGSGGTESGAGGTGGDENGGTGGEVAQGGSGQGGSDEPPPIVDVEVGQCEPFEPCGGDVEGVWTYTAACVDLDDLGLSEQEIDEMCPGAQITLSGQVSGTLTFADGVVTRLGQSSAEGEVFVPVLCAVALGGCAGVEDDLAEAGLAGAACQPQGNPFFPNCRCRFVIDAPEIDQVPFDTEADVIHLADGRDFAYCAVGDSLTYAEIGTATEPGVRELTRR